MFDLLCEDTFVLFAAKHYENPQCHSAEEFFSDLKRINYIKRLFGKYKDTGQLKERLILNHLVVLYNVFDEGTNKMLFYKLDGFYHILMPFMILLNRMPKKFHNSKGETVYSSDIEMDPLVIEVLRKI